MKQQLNLEGYLSNGVANIVKEALKATLSNPKESIFMTKYALAAKKASKLRKKSEENGNHIPPFLIASITSKCNLYCEGCYSRANNSCHDEKDDNLLTSLEWTKIFTEAKDLGVGFILLAGGEPFVRKDVIENAAKIKEIIFPVFTNGTMISEEYLTLFDENRNLIPVLSIEGDKVKTDSRRGDGVYEKLMDGMLKLQKKGIIYGASVTITKENINEAVSSKFLSELSEKGCKVVFFVEFVPVTKDLAHLAPEEAEREFLKEKLISLKKSYENMLFISFPGDEKTSGGCLAAGRGFFHINANGGAEPCPFSPYSDTNLRNVSLADALNSPLFLALQNENILMEEHPGGCVLFDRMDNVEEIMERNKMKTGN